MARESMHKQKIMELDASFREKTGTMEAKRLRRKGLLPVNLYGHNDKTLSLFVSGKIFTDHLLSGHRIVELSFSGAKEIGMVKEVQYDAFGDNIIHVDFARISLTENVRMQVQIRLVGTPKGVSAGGLLEHAHKELELEGPAVDIPEDIEIHIADMVIGDTVRVKDIEVPSSCHVFSASPEDVVVAVQEPVHIEEEKEEEELVEGEEGAEPEVVGKEEEGKTEEPDEQDGKK